MIVTQDDLQAVANFGSGGFNQSERNLIGALTYHAGQYKDHLDQAYVQEVGAVKAQAEAEVSRTHQQAEHFAATVVDEANLYTSGVRNDCQRTLETERQVMSAKAEK